MRQRGAEGSAPLCQKRPRIGKRDLLTLAKASAKALAFDQEYVRSAKVSKETQK
jgi:hypothetical protein